MPAIIVETNRGSITVNPTRLYVPTNSGNVRLQWLAAGAARITGIYFQEGAPISNLQQQSPELWTADWNPVEEATWKYDIDVSMGGTPLPRLDPEIENGPPGTVGDGED